MAKNKKKGGGVVLWSVLTGVSAVAFGAACVGTNLANASAQAVNIALKTSTNKTVGKDDSVKSISRLASTLSRISKLTTRRSPSSSPARVLSC